MTDLALSGHYTRHAGADTSHTALGHLFTFVATFARHDIEFLPPGTG